MPEISLFYDIAVSYTHLDVYKRQVKAFWESLNDEQ